MADINNIFNCSVQKQITIVDVMNVTSLSREELETSAGFNTITGIILVFFINAVVNNEHEKLRRFYSTTYIDKNFLWRIIVMTLLVLVSPVIVFCVVSAVLYKILCFVVIKWRDKHFVKFLDSFDVFWSLEDDNSKNIITVLGVIECNCPQNVLEDIKERLLSVSDSCGGCKIFYRRKEKYGFYYWSKSETIDIEKYIQMINSPKCNLETKDLKKMLTNLSDQKLPFNGEGMFQIFLTENQINADEGSMKKHALICRIHHSVGDGVALVQFLCQTLSDQIKNDKHFLNLSGRHIGSRDLCAGDLLGWILKLFEILVCLANAILRKPDSNSLHGPKLIGGCIFKWTDESENLYSKIKAIKDSLEGVSFSDVILAALSRSLDNFFVKTMGHVAEYVTVIIPARQTVLRGDINLENKFSVNVLDLPVNGTLEAIGARNKRLRESADYLTNLYFIKLCSVFPNCVLAPLMESKHATMSFSNMPGPQEISICGGNPLKSVVFFAPTKGSTGISLTALRYGGVLRLAASVDSAIISAPEDLDLILDGVVAEIKRLHEHYVKK